MKRLVAAILASCSLLIAASPADAAERSCSSNGNAGDTCRNTRYFSSEGLVVHYFYVWVGGRWVLDHTEVCQGGGGSCERLDPPPPAVQ